MVHCKVNTSEVSSKTYVQQDNAKPHSYNNEEHFVLEGSTNDSPIKFRSQPPN